MAFKLCIVGDQGAGKTYCEHFIELLTIINSLDLCSSLRILGIDLIRVISLNNS